MQKYVRISHSHYSASITIHSQLHNLYICSGIRRVLFFLKKKKKKATTAILPFHKDKNNKIWTKYSIQKNYLAVEAGGCVLLVAGMTMLVFQVCRSSVYLQATHIGLHVLLNLQLTLYFCFTDIHSLNTSVHMFVTFCCNYIPYVIFILIKCPCFVT